MAPPSSLLHGFLEHAHAWDFVAPRMPPRATGCWRSTGAATATRNGSAAAATTTPRLRGRPAGVVRARGRTALVAHSMGAGGATLFAGRHRSASRARMHRCARSARHGPERRAAPLRELVRRPRQVRRAAAAGADARRRDRAAPRALPALPRALRGTSGAPRHPVPERRCERRPRLEVRSAPPDDRADAVLRASTRPFWQRITCPVLYVAGANSPFRLAAADEADRLRSSRRMRRAAGRRPLARTSRRRSASPICSSPFSGGPLARTDDGHAAHDRAHPRARGDQLPRSSASQGRARLSSRSRTRPSPRCSGARTRRLTRSFRPSPASRSPASIGTSPGTRTAIWSLPRRAVVGRRSHTVNIGLPGADSHREPRADRVLFVDESLVGAEPHREERTDGETFVVMGDGPPPGRRSPDRTPRGPPRAGERVVRLASPTSTGSRMCYTSGTTGNRRARSLHRAPCSTATRGAWPTRSASERDVVLSVVPMFHATRGACHSARRWSARRRCSWRTARPPTSPG